MWWLWMACSLKVPEYLLDPYTVPHADCSQVDHIRAVGYDKKDAAIAQQNARRRLAESISSSLQSIQTSKTSVEQTGGMETSHSQYDAVSTVIAVFPYNHLIHDVEPVHRSLDGYRALACVQRSEIEKAIVVKHRAVTQQMGLQFAAMAGVDDVRNFIGMRHKYQQAMETLSGDMTLLQTLSDGSSSWVNELMHQQQKIEELSVGWRQRTPVSVTTVADERVGEMASVLTTFLQASQVQVERGDCSDSGYDVHLWKQQTTQKGPMGGYVANVSIMMRVTECGGDSELLNVEIAKGQGYHSSRPELSIQTAEDKATLPELPRVFETLLPL